MSNQSVDHFRTLCTRVLNAYTRQDDIGLTIYAGLLFRRPVFLDAFRAEQLSPIKGDPARLAQVILLSQEVDPATAREFIVDQYFHRYRSPTPPPAPSDDMPPSKRRLEGDSPEPEPEPKRRQKKAVPLPASHDTSQKLWIRTLAVANTMHAAKPADGAAQTATHSEGTHVAESSPDANLPSRPQASDRPPQGKDTDIRSPALDRIVIFQLFAECQLEKQQEAALGELEKQQTSALDELRKQQAVALENLRKQQAMDRETVKLQFADVFADFA